jgi:hypothetical protein
VLRSRRCSPAAARFGWTVRERCRLRPAAETRPTIQRIRSRGLHLLGLLLAASLALASCGEEARGPDEPRITVQRYIEALTRGDARSACRLITPRAAREDLVWTALALKARRTGSAPSRCLSESKRAAAHMGPALKRRLRSIGLSRSRIKGARACVSTSELAQGLGFPLVRSPGGGWRVDGLEPFLAFPPMSGDLRPGGRDYHGCRGRVPGGRRVR